MKKKAPAKRKTRAKTSKAASQKGDDFFAPVRKLVRAANDYARRLGVVSVSIGLVGVAGLSSVLWAGGYLGALAEDVDRQFQDRVAAAGFAVERVALRGRSRTSIDDINNAIGPVVGDSLPHLDLDAARARIESLGWVRSAAVTRLLPHTLHVSIRERQPAAVWQLSGAFHLIDREGAIIKEINRLQYRSLPHIVGAGAPEAAADLLGALGDYPDIEQRVEALVRVGERRWNLRLRNALDIKLPQQGLRDTLEALSIMQAAHGTLDRDLEYIDLRDPEQVTMRPRKTAAADVSQKR